MEQVVICNYIIVLAAIEVVTTGIENYYRMESCSQSNLYTPPPLLDKGKHWKWKQIFTDIMSEWICSGSWNEPCISIIGKNASKYDMMHYNFFL